MSERQLDDRTDNLPILVDDDEPFSGVWLKPCKNVVSS